MNKIKTAIDIAGKALHKYSPSILIGYGLIAGTTAGIKAVKDTPKAIAMRSEKKTELGLEAGSSLPIKEELAIDAKIYGLPIAMWIGGAGAIILAHKVDLRRQAALLAAMSYLMEGLRTIKSR